ncbi:MAG: excinuclease ABC subunit B [Candidatus Schekmanbacteria bacterium RBG_13_48_7]|uniref:UvrABC system protein B n=1 Tax=Candidatus Schekmanbacteria bacterium RBG_13_48_7 TaxID=1817878 RepID=A0A1F7RV94_9BACT|nr:MAG: excinuclease ABC subunit B [Candidatus Schekmanbacteria bacterium RBG_13_48_7]
MIFSERDSASTRFKIQSEFVPRGDQENAIKLLSGEVQTGKKYMVLLGVTGSGKTFTMANVIEKVQKPTLVIVHNKTLAAQLYREFKNFFPENAVEYFVSYYDYYQPEAYLPASDTYIEKDASINDEIDRMRHSATRALFERRDVIVVASVSCIYGLGSPDAYYSLLVFLSVGRVKKRQDLLRELVSIQYERNDFELRRGTFRVRGDVVEIFPAYEHAGIRVGLFGDEIEKISIIDPLTGKSLSLLDRVSIFPNTHYVTQSEGLEQIVFNIRQELNERLDFFRKSGKLLEAQRLEERTNYDLEMIKTIGYCQGIENYSRHFDRRKAGETPYTLLDYFPDDYLIFIDESHVTIPQLHGMYNGDRARKRNLVDHGFRLPCAFDNRPLRFEEFEEKIAQLIFVSATPSKYEISQAAGITVEQVIRPTGLIDPEVEVRPVKGQVDDLMEEIKKRADNNERVLVTTLTKRMAEDLTDYYLEHGLKVQYLHSDIDTIERVKIIKELREGKFDALIGINLLREGLDIPEVSLVAILDADKEGFLRSTVSLIQTIGRTARNIHGYVILYADTITNSMKAAIGETQRRRTLQAQFNKDNGITPETIRKSIENILESVYESDYITIDSKIDDEFLLMTKKERFILISKLETEMKAKAKNLQFEDAAILRDKILELKKKDVISF